MLVVGLLVLAAAVVVGAAGVAANTGVAHQLPGGFSMFGYHVHGSAGRLFFGGLLVGAVGMLGIIMVADGLRRNAALRRELMRFRRDARAQRRAAVPETKAAEPVSARTAPTASSDAADTTPKPPKSPKSPTNPPGERATSFRGLRDRWPVGRATDRGR
jgi:hypothetical protein